MNRNGFYRRRRGILEHLEAGTVSLLESGIHDYLCLKANSLVGASDVTIPPGIVFTSSVAIAAMCPREVCERTIRRKLDHLEEIGWIKRWKPEQGKRGNYPVLVARLYVRDTVRDNQSKDYWVNAEATTDWRKPVLVEITRVSVTNREPSPQLVPNVSVHKEVKNLETEKQSSSSPGVEPRSRKPGPLSDDDLIEAVLAMPGSTDPNGQLRATYEIILDRARRSGTIVNSPNYLVEALANFDFSVGADREEVKRRMGMVPQ